MSIGPNDAVAAFLAACRPADLDGLIASAAELYRLLEEYNRHTNLTRITDASEFWNKHVADSLAIGRFFPELQTERYAVADIGCGAGFPALILALAYPQLQLTAIDSIGKKTAFVAEAAVKLGLTNLHTVTGRSREMIHQAAWQEKFDLVTARAVADARTIFRESRAMLRPDGGYILYQTPVQAAEELPQVAAASEKYGWHWTASPEFELPDHGGARVFISSRRH